MARVRRVDCSQPGIQRIGRGRGFSFHEEDGELVRDREVLDPIGQLAIPPAWKQVWVCPIANGHIQATGFDIAGRKQYLYHDAWRANRDREKFDEMLEFGRALPKIRERLRADLRKRDLVRDRVLACAVMLLDLGFFRIGSDRYAEQNETYGLATLRKRHVSIRSKSAQFEFEAKGSERQTYEVAEPAVQTTLRRLKERRGGGAELLAYRREGKWVDVKATDVNEYLKRVSGGEYSAKDFRTWNATVLAAIELARRADQAAGSKAARRRAAKQATQAVADYLRNTPAVCRSAYIDPRVFDRFDSGETIALERMLSETGEDEFVDRLRMERAVLRLLSD